MSEKESADVSALISYILVGVSVWLYFLAWQTQQAGAGVGSVWEYRKHKSSDLHPCKSPSCFTQHRQESTAAPWLESLLDPHLPCHFFTSCRSLSGTLLIFPLLLPPLCTRSFSLQPFWTSQTAAKFLIISSLSQKIIAIPNMYISQKY